MEITSYKRSKVSEKRRISFRRRRRVLSCSHRQSHRHRLETVKQDVYIDRLLRKPRTTIRLEEEFSEDEEET